MINPSLKRFQVHDFCEFMLLRKLLAKANPQIPDNVQEIDLSLLDIYPSYLSLDLLEVELSNRVFEIFETVTEDVSFCFSFLIGEEYQPATKKKKAIDYYNEFIENNLTKLKSGIGYMSIGPECKYEPYILDYYETKESGLKKYMVSVLPSRMISGLEKFVQEYLDLKKKLSKSFESALPGNAPSLEFQGCRFLEQVKERQKFLGVNKVNMGLSDWGMRITAFEDKDSVIPHPFTMTYTDKATLPLVLEAQGIIDIHGICLINKPLEFSEADIQYVVSYPCTINILNSENTSISTEQRKTLSESQIVIIEKIVDELNSAMIFAGKPQLKKDFIDILVWLIKKITYCIEEESFLSNRFTKYHKINYQQKYTKYEDDFFLPFLHEKLIETFGGNDVAKKPEKFKGEIDLLFRNTIPLELKVWLKNPPNLETSIDEKYPHIGQTSAYASIDRVGFLVVLDYSNNEKGLKNLENCWRVLSKEFQSNPEMPTKIVSLIFDCNHAKPSSL